jgi:hypothetical protein
MTDKPDITSWVRALAEARGLDRALKLYPATVAAAVERGTSSMTALPDNVSPLTEPADAFDPETFAERKNITERQ